MSAQEPCGEECANCGHVFDPNATRWLCPHCHFKASCCSGAPLPQRPTPEQEPAR